MSRPHNFSCPLPVPTPDRPCNVLLIEDDECVRSIVHQSLIRLSVNVYTAADGEEGLRTFTSHQSDIDLVVIDLSMPEIDGAAASRWIRERQPDLPIILMSAHSDEEIFERCEGIELNAILRKPFTPHELHHVVCNVMRERGHDPITP